MQTVISGARCLSKTIDGRSKARPAAERDGKPAQP
jgi:hypothetical protein